MTSIGHLCRGLDEGVDDLLITTHPLMGNAIRKFVAAFTSRPDRPGSSRRHGAPIVNTAASTACGSHFALRLDRVLGSAAYENISVSCPKADTTTECT